ncbi:GPW/gp25 family protein [Streptomyces sp. NBC_00237]|uniref:GPW/gp25 family protein n=1 Tax=Streptomyces sp. NBC_00237 TaxID=2975687 RepID=UPI0022514503|nr:GPW/gp25 family protein [Streptomyces sp. NBC_00237]MCX5205370.1 GPW/gp25 family protein [Streptomyces sp. NBC_00237]
MRDVDRAFHATPPFPIDPPFHIGHPFRLDARGRTAGASDAEHVRNLIAQFLFTGPGERVNRPDFGSGLLRRAFEPNSPELATAVRFTAQAGLMQWLGDLIEVRSVEVSGLESELRVVVVYALRDGGEVRRETLVLGGTP